jgi:hypothetical protein
MWLISPIGALHATKIGRGFLGPWSTEDRLWRFWDLWLRPPPAFRSSTKGQQVCRHWLMQSPNDAEQLQASVPPPHLLHDFRHGMARRRCRGGLNERQERG